ncbi:MAG: hypothetical protein F6J86_34680 [Symploca sp. SIO1B1]|nr:hypothetical protein [Symploca sp. SIO1C2]NER98913.1 hypothetical protein [Symploca sp. SIO1B1]
MKFLTLTERVQLQKILTHKTSLKTADAEFRSALLTNCGLKQYCSLIQLDQPQLAFVTILCQQLSEVHPTVCGCPRLGLVIFLEYLSAIDNSISSEDQGFINHVIRKWEQQQQFSSQKTPQNKIANLLAQGRQKYSTVASGELPIKVDRDVIIDYDLEVQMAEFRQKVGYEGAFVFIIGGHSTILEQYIIERLRRELKRKTGRQNEQLHIRLYRRRITTSMDIEREFFSNYQFEDFIQLLDTQGNTDIVMIIWNYDIPDKFMKPLAQDFWTKISYCVSPYLKNQSRCLVMVWANVGKRRLPRMTGFTTLPTLNKFEPLDLSSWFRNRLQREGIREEQIEHYLQRLRNINGDLIGTYQELNHIIHELQGSSRLYG